MWLAFKRIAPWAFLGALPIAALAVAAVQAYQSGSVGPDFRFELYPQAKLLLHWTNPFESPNADLSTGRNRIFPVPAVALVAPLTALAPMSAAVLDAVLLLAALAATLWVLDVRDWRIYGLACLWPPVISAIQAGNLTLVLGLLAALAWRYRDRPYAPGAALGAAVALKIFLWPLLVWLLAIKSYRAVATGAAIGVAGGFLTVLPFTSLHDYLKLLDNLGKTFGPESYNTIGLLTMSHVASFKVATVIGDVIGLAVLSLAYLRRSFPLALAAAFLLSPIVWLHYFSLLVIPLAIRWPRLSPPWFVPLVMIVCAGTAPDVRPWHIVIGLAVLTVVTVLVEWPPRRLEPYARFSRDGVDRAAIPGTT